MYTATKAYVKTTHTHTSRRLQPTLPGRGEATRRPRRAPSPRARRQPADPRAPCPRRWTPASAGAARAIGRARPTDDRSGRIGSGRGLRLESRAFDAMAAPPIPTGESAVDVKNGSIGEFSASEESVMMPPYGDDVTLDEREAIAGDGGSSASSRSKIIVSAHSRSMSGRMPRHTARFRVDPPLASGLVRKMMRVARLCP